MGSSAGDGTGRPGGGGGLMLCSSVPLSSSSFRFALEVRSVGRPLTRRPLCDARSRAARGHTQRAPRPPLPFLNSFLIIFKTCLIYKRILIPIEFFLTTPLILNSTPSPTQKSRKQVIYNPSYPVIPVIRTFWWAEMGFSGGKVEGRKVGGHPNL